MDADPPGASRRPNPRGVVLRRRAAFRRAVFRAEYRGVPAPSLQYALSPPDADRRPSRSPADPARPAPNRIHLPYVALRLDPGRAAAGNVAAGDRDRGGRADRRGVGGPF